MLGNEKYFLLSVWNIIDDSVRTLCRLQMRPLCILTGIIAVIILLLNTSHYVNDQKTKVKKNILHFNKTSLFAIKITFAKKKKKKMID